MSSKFMKSATVLGTVTLASLLLVACGSKPAEKAADAGSSEAKEITLYVEDQYKAFAETVHVYRAGIENRSLVNTGPKLLFLSFAKAAGCRTGIFLKYLAEVALIFITAFTGNV